MRDQFGAIVVGGGYFGCSAAYHLAKAGIKTLLLEKSEATRGASGANFGNVQVQDASMGLSLELTLRGFRRMQHMERELQSDIGYRPCPSLIAAEREAHLPALRALYEEKKDAGLEVRWLDGKAVDALEPNLAPGSVVAASYYEQGKIYPFHYLYALLRRGREHGLEIREFSPVRSLYLEGGVCRGVALEDGSLFRADHVVVAAGAGTRALCATAGLDVPVLSVKAEAFVTEPIRPFLRTYYSSAAFFGEAHSQDHTTTSLCVGQSHYGNLLVAETTKPHQGLPAQRQDLTSIEHCRNIREKLIRFFPALSEIQILRGWVTASPYTASYEPCLGKCQVPGLLLCAGFKSAAVMSAVAGEIVADLAAKDACDVDLSPFAGKVRLL